MGIYAKSLCTYAQEVMQGWCAVMQIVNSFTSDLCAIGDVAVHKSFTIVFIFVLIYLMEYIILKDTSDLL